MADHFDPLRSRISDEKMQEWLEAEITGDLTEVPNVGAKTVNAMEGEGVHSTWQLFGVFLSLKGEDVSALEHCDAFWSWLESCGTPAGHRSGVVLAVHEKLATGMNLPIGGDEITNPTKGGYDPSKSRVGEDTLTAFIANESLEDLCEVPGIGPSSSAALQQQGVYTVWQLFGKFFECKGRDSTFQEQCDEFYNFLVQVKTAPGHRAGVITCLAEKLALGLRLPAPPTHTGSASASSPAPAAQHAEPLSEDWEVVDEEEDKGAVQRKGKGTARDRSKSRDKRKGNERAAKPKDDTVGANGGGSSVGFLLGLVVLLLLVYFAMSQNSSSALSVSADDK